MGAPLAVPLDTCLRLGRGGVVPRMKKRVDVDYDSRGFLLEWLYSGVFVWPSVAFFSAIVGFISLIGILIVFGLMRITHMDTGAQIILAIYGMIVTSTAVGLGIGWWQRRVIRHWLGWEAKHWLRASAIGGFLGCVSMVAVAIVTTLFTSPPANLDNDISTIFLWALMPAYVTGLSVPQAWLLRKRVNGALLWVLANVVGGLVWTGVLLSNSRAELEFFTWILATLAQAGITGWALLWLFHSTSELVIGEPA